METEDAQGVEGKVSATQSPIHPPKQTKSRHQNQKAGDGSGEPTGCGDAETEDAQGVEEQVSVMQSPIPLPKQTKLRHQKHPRENKHKHTNPGKAKKKRGGSRLVLNKTSISTIGRNNHTCLIDAIMPILLPDKDIESLLSTLVSPMPGEGDTSILNIKDALAAQDLQLERVTGKYIKKGGAPYHLLQEHNCRLIINIKLTNQKKQTMS